MSCYMIENMIWWNTTIYRRALLVREYRIQMSATCRIVYLLLYTIIRRCGVWIFQCRFHSLGLPLLSPINTYTLLSFYISLSPFRERGISRPSPKLCRWWYKSFAGISAKLCVFTYPCPKNILQSKTSDGRTPPSWVHDRDGISPCTEYGLRMHNIVIVCDIVYYFTHTTWL